MITDKAAAAPLRLVLTRRAGFSVGKAVLGNSTGRVTLKRNRESRNNTIHTSFKSDLNLQA